MLTHKYICCQVFHSEQLANGFQASSVNFDYCDILKRTFVNAIGCKSNESQITLKLQ